MKSKVIFLFIFLIAESRAFAETLTLSDVYKAASQKTEPVPIAESQLRGSQAEVTRQKGTFMPQLSAGATYQRQSAVFTTTGENDQGNTRLTLNQSIFRGGRDRANLKAAESAEIAQKYNLANTRNTLFVEVARAYYDLLSARKEVANTQKSIDLTQKRIDELQKRKRIGKSRNIEVLASEAQRAVLEAQLLAAIGQRRIAKNNFINITGLERDVELDDSVDLPKEVAQLPIYLKNLNLRPDILSFEATLEKDSYLVGAAKSEHYPTLDLTANYYASRFHNPNGSDWDAALVLNIPFFTGGIIKGDIQLAEERRNQSELLLKQRRRDAESEIRSAYNSVVSAVEQVKALEKALSVTEQNYREQEKDYRYALATNLDVVQALNTLHDTQRTLDRTKYQAFSALAELKAAINQIEQ